MRQNNIITEHNKLFQLYTAGAVFCAIDTETTGLSATNGHVVEIGALKFSQRGIIDSYSVLINPGCAMPYEASRVNGITDEMLVDCPFINKILPDFVSFIDNSILVAHNIGFDLKFSNKELERQGYNKITNKGADTLRISKTLLPEMPSHKLQQLASSLGLDPGKAHRAYDDARVCMELFIHCMDTYRDSL